MPRTKKHKIKSKKKTRKKTLIPKTRSLRRLPSFHLKGITEKKSLKKVHSYIPTLYEDLSLMKSISPFKSIIGNEIFICNDDEIYNSKTKKCYPWNSQIAKNIALRNLKSNRKFKIKDIVGPKQVMGNCWLNCFFVIYFISDKGRKFFKHMRQTMITGKKLDGTPIKKHLQRLLFIFNKFIESIIRGKHSKINKKYALKIDTNVLIKEIYKNISSVDPVLMPNLNEAGNVELFYTGLMQYINFDNKIRKTFIYSVNQYKNIHDSLNEEYRKKLYDSHIIIIKITDKKSKKSKSKSSDRDKILSNNYFSSSNKKPTEIKIKDRTFRLDSAVLLDNTSRHFSAYITVNNEECMFEGYSSARIVSFQWKNKLNKKKGWRTFNSNIYEKNYNNFMKGYQALYYYRV